MRPPSTDSDAWIGFARRQGLAHWAAFLLESLEPLSVVGAQALHLLQPILGLGRETSHALGVFLEDDRARRDVVHRLTVSASDGDSPE